MEDSRDFVETAPVAGALPPGGDEQAIKNTDDVPSDEELGELM
jgi:hypothetical protein